VTTLHTSLYPGEMAKPSTLDPVFQTIRDRAQQNQDFAQALHLARKAAALYLMHHLEHHDFDALEPEELQTLRRLLKKARGATIEG
jgi:hypothetical protein